MSSPCGKLKTKTAKTECLLINKVGCESRKCVCNGIFINFGTYLHNSAFSWICAKQTETDKVIIYTHLFTIGKEKINGTNKNIKINLMIELTFSIACLTRADDDYKCSMPTVILTKISYTVNI